MKKPEHESKLLLDSKKIYCSRFQYIIQEEESEIWFKYKGFIANELRKSHNFYCHTAWAHSVFPSPCHSQKGWPRASPKSAPLDWLCHPAWTHRKEDPGAGDQRVPAPVLNLWSETSTDGKQHWTRPALLRNHKSSPISAPLTLLQLAQMYSQ